MRFTFTDDQLLFRSTLRDLLDKECTPSYLRSVWSNPAGRSPELWHQLAGLGVVGLTAPEAAGGMGLGETDLVLLLEEAGRAALPEPLVQTTAVVVPMLRDLGAAGIDAVAAGDRVATIGLGEHDEEVVADGTAADLIVLRSPDGALHAVDRGVVELAPVPALDGARPLSRVVWTPGGGTVIATGDAAARAWDAALDRGATAIAAVLLGLADRMLELAGAYARDRHQFGAPIGSFQAVKHLLANPFVRLDFARPVVYRAAWSVAIGHPDRVVHASMAKAYASEAALQAARAALQVHGAIGYTWEHDLHLFMKRAWALAAAWGDAAWHRRRVAAAVL